MNKEQKKLFILDTNVILIDPHALYNFEGVEIGIPSTVLEELDKFKGEGTDRGRNSREFARIMDSLREKGSLREGIALDNGSMVKILFPDLKPPQMPFHIDKKDNEILLIALGQKDQGKVVTFISKDINARVKADALGLETEDYFSEYVSEEEFYKGWLPISVPAVELKKDFPSVFDELVDADILTTNEFILLQSQHNPHNYRIYRYMGGKEFMHVTMPRFKWPLQPRNPQQLMALNLLLDPTIELVTLLGPAGTGKTFLAILAGLHQILVDDDYDKMLISRPVIPLGRDIGYLPGTIEEKLQSWMLPIFDNMEFIRHSVNIGQHFEELEGNSRSSKKKDKRSQHKDKSSLLSLQELIHKGKVSLEAITYMRGRSIPYQYILIDEAQNLTLHEVKTLISRVGEGSKIILAGDPYQIDSPYLDFSSNGLVMASERFKGQKLFGSAFLETSERSELSKLASELL